MKVSSGHIRWCCTQPFTDKLIFSLAVLLALAGCTFDQEEVIFSQYSFGMHLVNKDKLHLTIKQVDRYIEYTLFDSTSTYIAPSYRISISSDSIVYANGLELRLLDRKQFQLSNSTYEVLKYEDSDKEMTLLFNRSYRPLIIRDNHYKGHETWDRPQRKERLLLHVIRNDSFYLDS